MPNERAQCSKGRHRHVWYYDVYVRCKCGAQRNMTKRESSLISNYCNINFNIPRR